MSDNRKISLAEARDTAVRVCELIGPACMRLEIAGSVRRRAALVGDIEIVCAPRLQPDPQAPFAGREISALDRHLERVIAAGHAPLRFNPVVPCNGPRYKRLTWGGRIKVNLCAVLPLASWGDILAIRTGPADFSRLLVTPRRKGGALPYHLQQRAGALWDPEDRIETDREEDFFQAIGVPWWPPQERDVVRLKRHFAGGPPVPPTEPVQ